MSLLLIALGGAAGSVLRYLVGGAVQHLSPRGFPIGTLSVNVLGCLVVGILAPPRPTYFSASPSALRRHSPEWVRSVQ